ncbi:YfhO family protein, partial [Candidatus Dependentiae bacterium]|nr:YfhO family protein [Candidatus Dependentiae bacterium]
FSEKSINTVIKNIKWSFDETSLEVDNPNEKPVMLIFNDSYYHEWAAEINGKKTDLYTANFLFKSIVIPSGKNKIKFYFSYSSLKKGAVISIIVFAVTAIFVGIIIFKNRKTKYP